MNNTTNCNTIENSTQPHPPLAKTSHWLGRMIAVGLSFLLSLPLSIAKIITSMFIPTKDINNSSLKEKLIEPIPAPIEKKEEDPLDLSNAEMALCASGLFTLAASTIGLPWGMQWLGGPYASSFLFQSATYTIPTTPMGILLPLMLKKINSKAQDQSPTTNVSAVIPSGFAPLATLNQTHLTYQQTQKALQGIKTCIQYAGKKDSWTIARNLFVHSVNIATSGYNLLASAKISGLELLSYTSWALKYAVSEEYAYATMGSICPVPFMPNTSNYQVPPLPDTPSLLEKVSFVWNKTYSFLTGGPIGLCFYPPNSQEALQYKNWSLKHSFKILGNNWLGIFNN